MSSFLTETTAEQGLKGAAASDLPFAVLQTMLTHGSEYLRTIDLGRLSICCKTMSLMTENEMAWKNVFCRAVSAGAVCEREFNPHGRQKTCWSGEPGLLDCFSQPGSLILAKTGYKTAACCLLSKSCFHCGKMSSTANPLLMKRHCDSCYDENQDLWLIAKSKAKEAFLLTEKDCKDLRSASFGTTGLGGNAQTSVVLLISEVMAASFAKYGGADGLAAEFATKKQKAVAKYMKTLQTDKPQKKRPKIESVSDRPAENLASLRYHFGSLVLPIPCIMTWYRGSNGMTHATKCKVCKARGTACDILMHERLEHFPFPPQQEDGDEIVLELCGPAQGASRSIPEEMNPAAELVELFAHGTINHEYGSKKVEWEGMDTGCVIKKYISHMTFGNATVVVDCDLCVGTQIDVNSMEVFMQTAPGAVPVALVQFAWSNEEYEPFNECCQFRFGMVVKAMGLKETSSSQFLAALISCSVGVESFFDLYCKDEPSGNEYPVIHGALTLLDALVDSDDED